MEGRDQMRRHVSPRMPPACGEIDQTYQKPRLAQEVAQEAEFLALGVAGAGNQNHTFSRARERTKLGVRGRARPG